MSERRVEFPPDGQRRRVEPAELAAAWVRATTIVPPQYACATAQHESDFTVNEVDTEPPDEHGRRFVSCGVFQLSTEEAHEAGLPGADLLDLAQAAAVLARIAEHRIAAIAVAAKLDPAASLPPDAWAYLAIAHNQGLAAALHSIRSHGLDWPAYTARNIGAAQAKLDALDPDDHAALAVARDKLAWWHKVAAYGNDCITGGSRWSEVTPP